MDAISVPSFLLGIAGVGASYFSYLCATKGVPAAWAWLKSKLSATSSELAELKADFEVLKADVAGLKSAATPPAAPSAQ